MEVQIGFLRFSSLNYCKINYLFRAYKIGQLFPSRIYAFFIGASSKLIKHYEIIEPAHLSYRYLMKIGSEAIRWFARLPEDQAIRRRWSTLKKGKSDSRKYFHRADTASTSTTALDGTYDKREHTGLQRRQPVSWSPIRKEVNRNFMSTSWKTADWMFYHPHWQLMKRKTNKTCEPCRALGE